MPYNSRGYLGGSAVGDPFLGGLIKGIGKVASGAVGGLLRGGPIGAIGGALGSVLGGPRIQPAAPRRPQISLPPLTGIGGRVQVPTPLGPLGIGGGATFSPGARPAAVPAGGCPSGYHLNKSDYFLRDGTFVPAGSRYVRNRRRNPANPRALRRAISRSEGFGRLVQRNRKALRKAARAVG